MPISQLVCQINNSGPIVVLNQGLVKASQPLAADVAFRCQARAFTEDILQGSVAGSNSLTDTVEDNGGVDF